MSTFVGGADVRFPAEAQNSAVPPSIAPEPEDGPEHREERADPTATDSGSLWLQDEIARRAARSSGSGGRHARRDNSDPSAAAGYVARHSTATPGPVAAAPDPVGGPPPPRKLPRRGPAGANGDTEAWTGPDRSLRDRSVVGGPSLLATGVPARPSGAAAARLLQPVLPAPQPVAPPDPPAPSPSAVFPSAVSTGAWPAPSRRQLTPPGGTPAPGGRRPYRNLDPGPLTAPVLGGPVLGDQVLGGPVHDDDLVHHGPGTGSDDEILWSASALPPPRPPSSPLVDNPPPAAVAVPEQRADEPLRGARFLRTDGSDTESPKRVRVVLAERKGGARPVRTVVDIQEATAVGELLRSNLIRSQLTVALRFAAGAGLTLGILPLLFALFPAIGELDVFGLRLPWLLLGVLVYPFLLGLGWWHTRTAERVEQNFADHVQG